MNRVRAPLALSVALALAAAGCEDVIQPTQPDSGMAMGNVGPAVPAASCDATVTGGSSIQTAVDNAAPGDRVCVESGVYVEQVVIDKDLTLQGFDDPVIRAPADPDDFTIPESGSIWEPIVFAFGGSLAGGAVSNGATVDVHIDGFVVDGEGLQNGGRRGVGILLRNANGTVAHNTVQDMGVGGRETMGILAYGDSRVRIAYNDVSEYERGGIGANGDGGARPDPQVTIENNWIQGSTGIGEAWAPNGIQVGFGATGRIVGNTVSDNRWAPDGTAAWAASCILVFESDGVQIRDNAATNCDAGVAVEAWGWFLPSADNAKVQGNAVEAALFGISVRAVAFAPFSMTDPSASNGKITGNELLGNSIGEIGISIGGLDFDPDFDPIADNNKVIRNTISGFDTPIQDTGTNTKNQVNAITP